MKKENGNKLIEIKKLISIGSNCIGTDILHFANLRIPSPVDNFSGFNIWKAYLLFNKEIKRSLFHEDYESRPATSIEKVELKAEENNH